VQTQFWKDDQNHPFRVFTASITTLDAVKCACILYVKIVCVFFLSVGVIGLCLGIEGVIISVVYCRCYWVTYGF
jgi:hypothetical protein